MAENFRNRVAETVPSAVFLHLLPDPDDNTQLKEKIDERNNENSSLFTLDSLSPLKLLPPSIDDIKARGRAIKRKLQFTEDEIDLVEKRTKLQSDSRDWFEYRKGRLTASKCKRIASLKATTSPTKALREILSYNQVPQTTAMQEGLEREDDIEKALLKHMEQNGHHAIRMEKSGFVVSKTHEHIGASPDRIMYDPSESSSGVSLAQVWLK